jgi:NitT/TauT family transport system substrate-binding protein
MRVTVSDVVSPSYFPLTAAVELGFFKAEGLDAELIFPPVDPGRVLVDGDVDFYGASPYIAFECLSEWRGGKILCALSQYTYWFLAIRADLGAVRGDMSALKGLRISASGQPGVLLRKLLVDGGLDFERDKVQVVAAPRPPEGLDNLARVGIQALTEGSADGFWGNAMRAELAIRRGMATMLLDVRRGDGPDVARGYTFPALVASEKLVAERPDAAAAAVRAIVKAQQALRADPSLAADAARRIFPPEETGLIGALVARDAPFFDPTVSPNAIDGACRFAQSIGQLTAPVPYEQIVATQFQHLWTAPSSS